MPAGFYHTQIQPHSAYVQVYLAKWRETTVAVKVLGALGAGTSSLDDEFPDAAAAKTHPLYESLQKVRLGPRGPQLAEHGLPLKASLASGCRVQQHYCSTLHPFHHTLYRAAGGGHDGQPAPPLHRHVPGRVPGSARRGDRVLRARCVRLVGAWLLHAAPLSRTLLASGMGSQGCMATALLHLLCFFSTS